MSIVNIIDRRKRKYRFYTVNAIIEAAWHDNSCTDSDQIDDIRGPDYEEKEHIQLHEAIEWANGIDAPVTLYVYDQTDGIYISETRVDAPHHLDAPSRS